MSSESENTNLQEQEPLPNGGRRNQRSDFVLSLFGTLIRHAVNLAVFIITLGGIKYLLKDYYADALDDLAQIFGPHKFAFLGVVAIGGAGVALYAIRQKWRVQYGLLEIAFALVYGFSAILKVSEKGYTEFVGIVAAVYLVVRGVDNVMIGFNASFERAKHPSETPEEPSTDH